MDGVAARAVPANAFLTSRPGLQKEHVRRPSARLPVLAGVTSMAGLLAVDLVVLTLGQSLSHALEQLARDALPVSGAAAALGVQIGLFVHLRAMRQHSAARAAGALAGAGTGTSALGMLACCAHHVAEVAPLLGLAGVSALSGAAALVTEWKTPLIAGGLVISASNIALTARAIVRASSGPVGPIRRD